MSNLHTPLHAWHVSRKARMMPFGGWEMPVQYAGITSEHRAVRTAAGHFDISHMARLHFTGTDALKLLETIFTNSVATMKDGQVRYGLICREDGGVLDDILVYRWPDSFLAVVNAANREKIEAWLERHRAGLAVEMEDRTFTTAMIAVQGPNALEWSTGLFADDVSGLKYYHAMPTQYRKQPCIVSRTGYTGEDGLEVIVANTQAVNLWEALFARGSLPCGLGARDTLRLEAAMPLYGHELTEELNPIQAGLGWAVKLEKGEFIGREALRAAASVQELPVRVGLVIESKRAAREGSVILAEDGTTLGSVTSGSFAPTLEKSIAMGYVVPKAAAVGTKLAIDVGGAKLHAVVSALPFYKRSVAAAEPANTPTLG